MLYFKSNLALNLFNFEKIISFFFAYKLGSSLLLCISNFLKKEGSLAFKLNYGCALNSLHFNRSCIATSQASFMQIASSSLPANCQSWKYRSSSLKWNKQIPEAAPISWNSPLMYMCSKLLSPFKKKLNLKDEFWTKSICKVRSVQIAFSFKLEQGSILQRELSWFLIFNWCSSSSLLLFLWACTLSRNLRS